MTLRTRARAVKASIRSALVRLLRAGAGRRVLAGPFRGMAIPDSPFAVRTPRFLLGTHEIELHDVIERLVAGGYRTIINAGAGQGYYAIGLALRCPGAQVLAFETVPEKRTCIERAAEANGVASRVTVQGACDAHALRQCLAAAEPPVLLVVDIEGYELAALEAEMATQLSAATVLVETHDHRVPGTTDQLLARFAATHRVERYAPRDRTGADLPSTLSSGRWRAVSWLLIWIMKESRAGEQRWLLFTPRHTVMAASRSEA